MCRRGMGCLSSIRSFHPMIRLLCRWWSEEVWEPESEPALVWELVLESEPALALAPEPELEPALVLASESESELVLE